MTPTIDALITTERLYLRPLNAADVTAAYVEALNDPEVVGLTEARHVRWDRQAILEYIAQSNREGISQLLGMFLKDSDQHIGNVRLFNFSAIHRRVELGIMIFGKAQWSKGYGTEVLQGVSAYLFETLRLQRICADYYAPNTASARMFEKAGFQIEGVFKHHFLLDGQPVDSVRVAKINNAQPVQRSRADGGGSRAMTPQAMAQPRPLIPSAGPSITEREVQLVAEAAREGWYANMRRYIDEFERRFAEYTGMRYALATSNCTGAIHLALLALGIGPGDEVIVPDITWVASAAPICYVGARPVFIDIDPTTWCLSPEACERAITRRTKAVVAVGLLGNMPDMDAICTIAARRKISIIEDAAESLGATYKGKPAGAFGRIGVFSFNGTKLMVTGEGGMIVTNDRTLHERVKRLAHHGINKRPGARYYWSHELGYKYQFTNIQAALGLAQFSRLEELIEQRRAHFRWYQERLSGVEGLQLNDAGPFVRSPYWIVTAIISRRYGLRKERIVQALEQRGIGGRPFFYPLTSMPTFQPYSRGKEMRKVNPVSYAIAPYGVCLPSSASLTEAEVDVVCEALTQILRRQVG